LPPCPVAPELPGLPPAARPPLPAWLPPEPAWAPPAPEPPEPARAPPTPLLPAPPPLGLPALELPALELPALELPALGLPAAAVPAPEELLPPLPPLAPSVVDEHPRHADSPIKASPKRRSSECPRARLIL